MIWKKILFDCCDYTAEVWGIVFLLFFVFYTDVRTFRAHGGKQWSYTLYSISSFRRSISLRIIHTSVNEGLSIKKAERYKGFDRTHSRRLILQSRLVHGSKSWNSCNFSSASLQSWSATAFQSNKSRVCPNIISLYAHDIVYPRYPTINKSTWSLSADLSIAHKCPLFYLCGSGWLLNVAWGDSRCRASESTRCWCSWASLVVVDYGGYDDIVSLSIVDIIFDLILH